MSRNRRRAVFAAVAGAALALPAAANAAGSYEDSVLAQSPQVYLRLSEAPGASVAHDASPYLRHAVPAGDVTFGVAGPFSDAGTAVRLGKTGSLTADVPVASGSVELWVNPDRPAKNTQPRIVAHGDPAGDGWGLKLGPKRKLMWYSGAKVADTKITLGTGVWTALTVTWDGQKVRFYRNGALSVEKSVSFTMPASSRHDLVVGGGMFSGRIDEPAVYQGRLSDDAVRGHFVAAHVPVNTALPTISGTAELGNTLTVTPGTWTDAGAAPTYQWQRCDAAGDVCVDVAGATGAGYALASGAQCSTYQVVETVANANGIGSATSNPTAVVEPCNPATQDPAPLNEAPPTIDGTPAVGATLTVQRGVWSFGVGEPAYRWQRCNAAGNGCADVADATATTYTPAAGDACATFRVVETVGNATGTDSAFSDATGVVGPCGSDPGSGGSTGGETSPTTTPAPGTTPVVSGPAGAAAGCLKLLAGRRKLKLRGLGTLRLKATAGSCLTAPLAASFKARKGVKLKSVRYKLDGKRLKRAKLKPAALRAGTHTLSVRVTPRGGRAKQGKLRLRVALG
jgi:hypothetical protein